jgi:hypothetical protein
MFSKLRQTLASAEQSAIDRVAAILRKGTCSAEESYLMRCKELGEYTALEDEIKRVVGMSRALVDTSEPIHLMHDELGEIKLHIPAKDGKLSIEFLDRPYRENTDQPGLDNY